METTTGERLIDALSEYDYVRFDPLQGLFYAFQDNGVEDLDVGEIRYNVEVFNLLGQRVAEVDAEASLISQRPRTNWEVMVNDVDSMIVYDQHQNLELPIFGCSCDDCEGEMARQAEAVNEDRRMAEGTW